MLSADAADTGAVTATGAGAVTAASILTSSKVRSVSSPASLSAESDSFSITMDSSSTAASRHGPRPSLGRHT